MHTAKIARLLRAGTALTALATGVAVAAPAFAQDAPAAQQAPTTPADTQADSGNEIVVTGSLIATRASPSPVTIVNAESLDRRGISTTQDAIQQLAANNGPALTNSFSANGAFASGASAVSLRGLSTNSTLTLFNGMRAAYYPLADDGTRNFVDLNTIPDDIVERIEVLRDGASSAYGADAIAGVVNIITRKEIQGISGRAEAGISERGDSAQYRLSLTAGIGDLEAKGYNAYLSGFYYKSNGLYNRDRGYPYNSDDLRRVCHDGNCGPNNVVDGLDGSGAYPASGFSANVTNTGSTLYVRPANALTGGQTGRYQLLNPALGCPRGTRYDLTAADLARTDRDGNLVNAAAPTTVCQEDLTQNYGMIAPEIERFGVSGRVTARFGDSGEAYGEFNFLQTEVSTTGLPTTIRGNAPAPFYYPRYSTSANVAYYGNNTVLQLPVYVCPRNTIGACTAANGTLNPNNPFAAAGQTAALIGRLPNMIERDQTRTRAYRGALGVKGNLSDAWTYDVNGTAMHIDLRRRSTGYVYIQHLLDVIADGSFNFINPAQNSQATLDYLAPTALSTSTSDLFQVEGRVTGKLVELPGGPLQLALGTSVRYEAVDSPSINSDFNGATERYYRLNGFATKGDRTVYSAFAELNAPIVDALTINLAGRYDRYTGGLDNFSPKAGFTFTPVRQVTLRGTYSRGFRVPSFGEANATFPTTGYVSASRSIYPDSYLAQYGCNSSTDTNVPNNYNTCPAYIRNATYGQTTLSNPQLKPEKSRSFTAGIDVEPVRGIKLSVDYYNIKKTGAIASPNFAPAIAAYYSGQPIPTGYTVIPDAADTGTPGALPRIAFVQAAFINANTIKSEGLDFAASVDIPVSSGLRIHSQAEASYILRLETQFPDGTVERYDGTLGNFNLTAGSGTPKWHGTWMTTLDFDSFLLTGTVNYFGGYNLSAVDQGTGYKDCGLSDGSVACDVSSYITFDLNAQVRVNDRFTFYANVMNLFDRMPPVDPITYGAHLYNPVQGGNGIYGRYFKAGVKVGF